MIDLTAMFLSMLHSVKHKLVMVEQSLPNCARGPYQALLNWSKTTVSTALSLRLPVYRLEADESNGLPRVGYLGVSSNLNFVAHLVCGRVPELQPTAYTSLLRLDSTIQQMKAENDLVVVELPQRLLRHLFHHNGLLVIPWVKWQIETRRPWHEIERAFHRTSVRSDLKKLKESAVQCVRTHEQSAFERFYWDMYRPSMSSQHDDLAGPTSFELLQIYFSAGWLTFYVEGNQILGGAVQYVADKVLYDYVMGFNGDISRPQQTLVTVANYYDALRSAWEMNCKALDLGLTRPLLNDGVVRYKRKWGSTIMLDSSQNWGLWIHISRKPGEAMRFLTQHPWIWVDHEHNLKGLLVTNNRGKPLSRADVEKTCKRLWIPGLHSITVYATSGFAPEIPLSQGPIPAIGPITEWKPVTK